MERHETARGGNANPSDGESVEDARKRLLAALRSGEYHQGFSALREKDCFCVLGLACDLYDPTKWHRFDDGSISYTYDGLRRYFATAPTDVLRHFGLNSLYCVILNDMERKTFPQIADELEKAWGQHDE